MKRSTNLLLDRSRSGEKFGRKCTMNAGVWRFHDNSGGFVTERYVVSDRSQKKLGRAFKELSNGMFIYEIALKSTESCSVLHFRKNWKTFHVGVIRAQHSGY